MKSIFASIAQFVRSSREAHVARALRSIDKNGALAERGMRYH